MFRYFLLIFLLSASSTMAQSTLRIYFENNDNGTDVFADNSLPIVQSAQIDFGLVNLKNKNAADSVYVIPAFAKKYLLTKLTTINPNKSYNVSTNAVYNFGNYHQQEYDDNFIYSLPFPKGKSYKIYQGYNGTATHRGENALDFSLAEGDEILAARGGIVFQMEENNSRNCLSPSCEKYNNYISIVHDDGTIAEYTHLKKDGAAVNIGDTVVQNQLIGYSGKTGWTDGPHLHFEVYLQRLNTKETVKTLFRVSESEDAIFLDEKKTYKKDY